MRQFINVMSRVLLGAFFCALCAKQKPCICKKKRNCIFSTKAIDKYKDVVYTVVSYIKRFIKVIINRKMSEKFDMKKERLLCYSRL